MNKIVSFLVLSSLFLSCSNDFEKEEVSSNLYERTSLRGENEDFLLKKKFSLALHEAMLNNVDLRSYLKSEALKTFDGDFDVLFNYVKDNNINGKSFRDIILPYFETEEDLVEIETKIPTLTIFIPTLPEDSFSAELWKVEDDVPLVAVRLLDYDKTAIFSSNSEHFTLDNDQVPGFPVVVIKDNERIIIPEFDGYATNRNPEYTSINGSFRFKFIFNFIFGGLPNALINGNLDPAITDSWNLNGQSQNIGWQRDHIYYGINVNNPNGPFINNHQERISSFKIDGIDGKDALDKISQPNGINNLADPTLIPGILTYSGGVNANSFWTDGYFEFGVYLYHGSNSANEGSRKEVAISARATDLFDIEYQRVINTVFRVYVVKNITSKSMSVATELNTWDLMRYSNTWKINIEEVDATVENESTTTESTKYNANFSADGIVKKIGMKLGASIESNLSTTVKRKWTEGSNPLGDITIHFGDNIIINQTSIGGYPFYTLRKYSSGHFTLSVRPVKVQ